MFKGLLLVGFLIASYGSATAHSWYPLECCSGYDCAEIDAKITLPDGSMLVTTKVGTVIFPKGFPIKPSQDEKEHACIALISKKPLCLFFNAGT